jgi:hypothetical protein
MKIRQILSFFSKKPLILLAIMIAAQSLCVIYYSFQKKNVHVDEFVTLRISNEHNRYHKPAAFEENKFINSQEFKNFIKIEEDERFHWNFVYKKSKFDKGVPPIYYLMIHTAYSIYSFFSDDFSMFPGIALNIVLFVLASIVLYFVSMNHQWFCCLI